ncbi:C10 family peptidase [Tenacibaculum sp. ZS6-P6]|uniref:C10 family peptidase n=1 Tax=Tenacibaculum sp. ZS6-P6 TaxID=3447503 RepID=UPI003F9660B6
MKKITLLSIFLLFFAKDIFANPVDKAKAIAVASNWIQGKQSFLRKQKVTTLSINEVKYKNKIVYYIINFKQGGFVIVSADDSTKPILGYSHTSNFEAISENLPTNNLLDAYKSFVYESSFTKKNKSRKATKRAWDNILNNKTSKQFRVKSVEPFMDDILYTQSNGFERFCPSDDDGQAIVGCVATAMSQVMRYWEFPKTGKSQTTYTHQKYGTLSVNFENQLYDWDNMSKTIADNENAKLSYHTGVAVKMNYGTSANGGSGAYTTNALKALKTNFKYNSGAKMMYRHYYSDQEWSQLLKNELNLKRPVLYSGRSKNLQDPNAGSAGHLFALDGYQVTEQGDFFHINWGWAGRSNGYFYLTEMITHGGKYNWIDYNSAIVDLYPTNLAPVFETKPLLNHIKINQIYEYVIKVSDENRNDQLSISIKEGSNWLSINKKEKGVFVLEGTPTTSSLGKTSIVLELTDGINTTTQNFEIIVEENNNQSYCDSKGYNTNYEWIDFVSFGGMSNSSGNNNGYADFTNKTATVNLGSVNELIIRAGYNDYSYKEHLGAWIDYNQNGVFEDNERIIDTSVNNNTNQKYSINIPNNALKGKTRMRVSMKYDNKQNSCESFTYGEVEDYTIEIKEGINFREISNNENLNFSEKNLFVYPIPATNFLNIKSKNNSIKIDYYEVIDLNGSVILKNDFKEKIHINNLKRGIYYILMYDENSNRYMKKFIKN